MSAGGVGAAAEVREPHPGAGPRTSVPAVRLAAQRVALSLDEAGFDAGRAAEVVEHLAGLVDALETGASARLPRPQAREAALRRRLLEPLAREVVRAWSETEPPPDAREMLGVLRGLEQLRAASATASGPGPLAWGAPPEGFDLIVEVAHDLRSPLTSILFLADTLLRGQSGELNELQRRQMGLVYAAAMGLVSLASDLIELAQGGERLVGSTPAPFSVRETLDSVCDVVRPIAEEKKIALRVLPPAGDRRVGFAAALHRVLLNLTTNALKFTEEGFVEITTHPAGLSVLEFSVRDTGPGIRQEARTTLFEPFHRPAQGGRHGFSGPGLGLAISRRLVQAMRSELYYDTRPGWGTRFYFSLNLPPAEL